MYILIIYDLRDPRPRETWRTWLNNRYPWFQHLLPVISALDLLGSVYESQWRLWKHERNHGIAFNFNLHGSKLKNIRRPL